MIGVLKMGRGVEIMFMSKGEWIFFLVVIALCGWGAIEFILWIFSHLRWVW